MEFRPLGLHSGIRVSLLGLGCNNFGDRLDARASTEVIHAAADLGVSFFDTAPVYANGLSEEILGKALRDRRSSVVLATKFGYPQAGGPRVGLAAPQAIRSQLHASLQRLQTDHIDLFQLHVRDPATPWLETITTLHALQQEGKILAAGASNLSTEEAIVVDDLAKAHGLRGFVCHQNELSLLKPAAATDLLPVIERRAMGFLPYFPLANGLLTGKYRAAGDAPDGSRLALNANWGARYLTRSHLREVERLSRWAHAHGRSLLELAMAWLAAQAPLASIIAGAMSAEQVASNAAALGWRMDPDLLEQSATETEPDD